MRKLSEGGEFVKISYLDVATSGRSGGWGCSSKSRRDILQRFGGVFGACATFVLGLEAHLDAGDQIRQTQVM
jgi:hypothetical protein